MVQEPPLAPLGHVRSLISAALPSSHSLQTPVRFARASPRWGTCPDRVRKILLPLGVASHALFLQKTKNKKTKTQQFLQLHSKDHKLWMLLNRNSTNMNLRVISWPKRQSTRKNTDYHGKKLKFSLIKMLSAPIACVLPVNQWHHKEIPALASNYSGCKIFCFVLFCLNMWYVKNLIIFYKHIRISCPTSRITINEAVTTQQDNSDKNI